MADKFKEAVTQLGKASKELEKEQHDLKVKKGQLQRDNIQLTAKNTDLKAKHQSATAELATLNKELDTLKLRLPELKDKNTKLELENHRLEVERDDLQAQIAASKAALEAQKASVDADLAAYSDTRKQEIKAEILALNAELKPLQEAVTGTKDELERVRTELITINKTYVNEQAELKDFNVSIKADIAKLETDKAAAVTETEAVKRELKELTYKRDNIMLTVTKAREEHQEFLEYERKARKVLDTQDKVLQNKAAEIATQSQFVKNSRSFLSEL